jgi:5-methylcytosine-specific restriction enzyme A
VPLAPRTCAQCQQPVPPGGRCPCQHRRRRRRPSHQPHSTPAWVATSQAHLATHRDCECPGCPACLATLDDRRACARPSEHTDHVDGLGPDGPRGYDVDNFQALCHSCHSSKTVRHDGGFGRART